MDRRELLKSAAGLPLGMTARGFVPANDSGFRHRVSLGWITDWASRGEPQVAWPSMRLDSGLIEDFRRQFDLAQSLGLTGFCIWGLYVSRYWPLDIRSAVTRQRGPLVEELIGMAHERGLKIYSGLGVYSWGFQAILKAHPELAKTNPYAMCGSAPEAWRWMRQVVDFVLDRFPIDGVSMQSADQGRCSCSECARLSDAEYHAMLNVRVSEYIRSRRPHALVAAGWGMHFDDPASLPALEKMGRALDYLIDVDDTGRRRDPAHRRRIIDALKCDFGTLGGPQTEPPQHWDRRRWFLPTAKRVGLHLQDLHRDGGRACEFFAHILANPGDEITQWVAALAMRDPGRGWEKHLQHAVKELYHPPRDSTAQNLAEWFVRAEDAYYRHLPAALCGTVSLEPLVSNAAGPFVPP